MSYESKVIRDLSTTELEDALTDRKCAERSVQEIWMSEFKPLALDFLNNHKNWEYKVEPVSDRFHLPRGIIPVAYAEISRRLNPEAVKQFLSDNSARPSDLFEATGATGGHWLSRTYYLSDEGIIHGCSGGSDVLITPRVITRNDWDMICLGNIPDKLIPGWTSR